MSRTRHAPDDAPLNQERYMSSPEYAELRGVMGGAVTAKAGLVMSARKRSLLFFLQALSLEPGGLRSVAQQLVEMFPKRCGEYVDIDSLAGALMDICINPRVLIIDGKDDVTRNMDLRRVNERHPEISKRECRETALSGFRDLDAALFEFQQRYEKQAEQIAKTNVAKTVFRTLDACLHAKRMVLIEGESDSGKSTSAEAWCRMHKGEARFVRLQGVTNRTAFFRAIARALGLASTYMRKAGDMQFRVEDMLQRSRLVLVVDESQYAFCQSERIYSRPELIDWIYTALCNHGVPVALIASPLFSRRLHQAERQVSWNSDQFRRRIYRYEILPRLPSQNDIDLVVRHHLPDADPSAQKYLAGYAATCITKRTHPETGKEIKTSFAFTAIADTLADAAQIAEAAGRPRVTLKDLTEAVTTFRAASELAKRQRFDEPRTGKQRKNSKPLQAPLNTPETALSEPLTEETFTGRRPVAALQTHPANSGRTPALENA